MSRGRISNNLRLKRQSTKIYKEAYSFVLEKKGFEILKKRYHKMVAKLSTIFWLNFNGVLNNSNACLFLPLLYAKNVLEFGLCPI
jgi:hypothetical protein